jgi:peptide/nickel transport system permease protein
MILVLLIVSIILFTIFQMMPGDRALIRIGAGSGGMRPETFQQLYDQAVKDLGLDKPVIVQYFMWMKNVLTFDFGQSITYRTSVINVIGPPMRNTLMLNAIGMVLVFAITIPLGIMSAVRRNKIFDNVVQLLTILGYSLPSFIFALIFIYIFAVRLNLAPVSGTFTVGSELKGFAWFLDRLKYMALPLAVYVFSSLGAMTRYVRAAMIDALRMDYIRTARAKGLHEKVVIYSHAFRNSLVPIITIVTSWLASLFSGSMIIEVIFSWGGIGRLMFDALMQRDFNIIFVVNLFYVFLALLAYLVMDVLYGLADPRVKIS